MTTHQLTWAESLAALVKEHKVLARMKVRGWKEESKWGWIISPVPTCLETGDFGPVSLKDVEWVEVDMIKVIPRGRLIPDAKIDVSSDVLQALENFGFSFEVANDVARVHPNAA